jgi:hypothetical protein
MAIGAGDFTAKAKKGWAFHFGKSDAAFSEWEAQLKAYLENQGLLFNRERIQQDIERTRKCQQIIVALSEASDEQITSILSTL